MLEYLSVVIFCSKKRTGFRGCSARRKTVSFEVMNTNFWTFSEHFQVGNDFQTTKTISQYRNKKHVPCFHQVKEIQVEVWENEKCCVEHQASSVSTAFRVLPNFHEFSVHVFYFLDSYLLQCTDTTFLNK